MKRQLGMNFKITLIFFNLFFALAILQNDDNGICMGWRWGFGWQGYGKYRCTLNFLKIYHHFDLRCDMRERRIKNVRQQTI